MGSTASKARPGVVPALNVASEPAVAVRRRLYYYWLNHPCIQICILVFKFASLYGTGNGSVLCRAALQIQLSQARVGKARPGRMLLPTTCVSAPFAWWLLTSV